MGSYTSVPVPKVIGWSSDSSNPVGSEYILMEKASGKQLFQVWGEMNQLQQFSLIKSLVQLESQLAAMQFPAYGSLYLWDSVSQLDSVVPIDDKYCLGPMYNASWFPQLGTELYAGPCKSQTNISRTVLTAHSREGPVRAWPCADWSWSCAPAAFYSHSSWAPFRNFVGTQGDFRSH